MGATLRASRTAGIAGTVLIAAAAVFTGVPGTSAVPSAAQGTPDAELIDRFLDVAEAVPEIDRDEILIGEFDLQIDLLGDLVGDHSRLEAVHEDARALFIEADDTRTALGDLLGDGARAVMLIEDGYRRLADYELIVPFQSRDELDVSVGTDEPRNLRRQGIQLVQEGHYRLEDVIVGLRGVELSADQAGRYRAISEQEIRFAVTIDPALRHMVQAYTSHEMMPVERYDADIAGTAVARWVSYICVPRQAAEALSLLALQEAITNSLGAGVADDCPDLPNPEVLTPADVGTVRVAPATDDAG